MRDKIIECKCGSAAVDLEWEGENAQFSPCFRCGTKLKPRGINKNGRIRN